MQSSANKKINLTLLYGTTSHSRQIQEKEVFRSQYIANGLSEYTAQNYAEHTGEVITGCTHRETYRLSECNDPQGLRGKKNEHSTYKIHARTQTSISSEFEK